MHDLLKARLRLVKQSTLTLCVLWIVVASVSIAQEMPQPVRIGVLAKRGPERCLEKWGQTAEYLTNEIPGYSFTIVPLNYDEIYPAVAHDEVHFILANPSFYVEMEQLYGASRVVTLKNLRLGKACSIFGGVVFWRAEREDIKHLDDLRGKRFVAVDERALAGWQAAWRELKVHGIDPYRDFSDLSFYGTQDAVVYAVRDGKVDAGSIRTDALERMAMEGKIRLEDFHVIHQHCGDDTHLPFLHSTRAYPEWPFAKARHTADELAEKVASALLRMSPHSPAARAGRCAGWTIPLNYQPVHECLKYLRLGPYRDYGKVTPRGVFRQYWPWLLGALAAVILLALFASYVTGLNRRLRQAMAGQRQELIERQRTEEKLCLRTEELRARVKELNCFYGVARLTGKPGMTHDEILGEAVNLIPPSRQFPEITCARILFEGQEYKTDNFRETTWKQLADIMVSGEIVGTVEAYYLEEKPEADEGPFLKEERKLIAALAGHLAKYVDRQRIAEDLHRAYDELEQRILERTAQLRTANEKLIREIGERRRAEEELRQAHKNLENRMAQNRRANEIISQKNEFLTNVIESLSHPFYVIDANDYTIKLANSAFGFDDRSQNSTCYALTGRRDGPCDVAGHTCPLKIVKKTKKPVSVEHIHYDKNGNTEVFEVHGYPILNKEGNVSQVIEYAIKSPSASMPNCNCRNTSKNYGR